MLKVDSFSAKGTKLAPFSLPKEIESKPNMPLLAQAVHVYRARAHTGLRDTKTRSEINRTTKKWYKQKGTGGARHGARSAPIFVGGGIAHGPQPLKRELVLPQALRQKALKVALTMKAREGKVAVVAGLTNIKKTKEAQGLIDKIVKEGNRRVTFVVEDGKKGVSRAFKNIKNSNTVPFRNLNAYEVFLGGTIIIDKDVFGKEVAKKEIKK